MSNARAIRRSTEQAAPQLTLFEPGAPDVPERFRIDEATRRRGMRHIARIRAHLEARYPSSPKQAPAQAVAHTTLGARAAGDRHAA